MKLSSTIRLCVLLLGFKIAYIGLLSAVLLLWPVSRSSNMFPGAMLRTTQSGKLTFASHFGTWDAEHYLILSQTGYKEGIAQCAFYPLWPLLIKWFSPLTGGGHVVSGMILANILSLAGWLIFFRIVARRLGECAAKLALVLLLAFPGALFFQFIYSESLFFFLLMLLCLGLEQNWFWLAFATALLLPLTKAVGVFCAFPILWHLLSDASSTATVEELNVRNSCGKLPGEAQATVPAMEAGLEARRPAGALLFDGSILTRTFKNLTSANCFGGKGFWILVALVYGWGIYFLLMWRWTGDPFEGFKAQQQWGSVQSIRNLFDLPKFVIQFVTPTCWHEFTGSALDRIMFVLLLWCIPIVWRLNKGWFIWMCVLGIVPAMSGTFTSFTRFESLVFPVFIGMAAVLSKPNLRWLRWSTLGMFAILHLILLWRFVNFRWAG